MKVDFFLIGAQKSGSTSIYKYFKLHPDIFVADREDPHFYSYGLGTEVVYERPGVTAKSWIHAIRGRDDYAREFSAKTFQTCVGDCSDSYYFYPGTADRIKDDQPNAKIIVVLRHPVARAYSGFNHSRGSGLELEGSFAKCMQRSLEEEAVLAPVMRYKSLGLYGNLLKPYLLNFGRDSILLVDFDRLSKNFREIAVELCAFLEVPLYEVDKVWANPSFVPPSTGPLSVIYRHSRPLRQMLRGVGPYSKIHAILSSLQRRFSRRPEPISPVLLSEYMALFENDIKVLTDDFGQGFWNQWR